MRRDRSPIAFAAVLGTLLLTGCGGAGSRRDGGTAIGAGGRGATIATLVDRDGDGALERGPAEPLRDVGVRPRGRAHLQALATVVQLTDAHIRDVESPARLPFLDRFGPPLSSTFRPQEALGLQVLDSAVQAANTVRPDGVVQTGDLADNAQTNELRQALTVLHGGTVHPGSGRPGPGGPQLSSDADPLFYRPDLDPPRHPGLLSAAQRPFASPGLNAPLTNVQGNHDLLVAGELAPDAQLRALAVGGQRVARLDPRLLRGIRVPANAGAEGSVPAEAVQRVLSDAPRAPTAADGARRLLAPAEADRLLGTRPGVRAFTLGSHVTGVALDLVNPAGGSQGVVTDRVLRELRSALRAAGDRPVLVFSHQPLASSTGGAAALNLLAADPHVVAAVAGHTHRNEIRRRGRLWLVATASLADFPQQIRALRIVRDAATGRVALDTWVIDHGPGPGGLAQTSRELAFLDAQGGRPGRFAGSPADRDRRLWTTVRAPLP